MSLFDLHRRKKNVIVLGANGMLGHDVADLLLKEQKREKSCIGIVAPLSSKELDITKQYALDDYVARLDSNPPIRYDYVVNCAAMTDTQKIEVDPDYRSKAYDVNALGVKNISKTCAFHKIKLVHVSTDYVFSQLSTKDPLPYGSSGSYTSFDAFSQSSDEFPTNTYGLQKLIGEKFIKESMRESDYAILRTSWLYGEHNSKSFVHKFLKNFTAKWREHELNAAEGEVFEFEMTQNEYSVPTRSETLAKMILNTIKHNLHGTFAACGIASDISNYAVSRKDWAEEILFSWLTPSEREHCKIVGVDRDTLAPKFSRMYNERITKDY